MSNLTYSRKSISNIIKSIERVQNTCSVDEQFLRDLNESIEKTDLKNQRDPSRTYKPSGMNCIRSCFYSIAGFPISKQVRPASSCGICESGTDRHIRIQQALEDMRGNGFDLDYIDVETYIHQNHLEDKLNIIGKSGMETKLYMPSLNMSVMTDGIIKYNGEYFIFEFKTEIPHKFYKRTNIDSSHISQGTAYSCAFGINRVMFLYENRATCDRKAYILNVTDEMQQNRIYGFIEKCNSYINDKIVPPMPSDEFVLKKCGYCPYQALCAKHGAAEKDISGEIT